MPRTHEEAAPLIAEAAHEARRVFLRASSRSELPPWASLSADEKAKAVEAVEVALYGRTFRDAHEGWRKRLELEGWKFGRYDAEAKTHPLLVPHAELVAKAAKHASEHLVRTAAQAASEPESWAAMLAADGGPKASSAAPVRSTEENLVEGVSRLMARALGAF